MKTEQKYKVPEAAGNHILEDSAVAYGIVESDIYGLDFFDLIKIARKGISGSIFTTIEKKQPFTLLEWSKFLNISSRTMHRYLEGNKTFQQPYSEKIMEITLLTKEGASVFGDVSRFNLWLGSDNVALGGRKPKDFLDTSFGISLVKDEINRIAHGILA